MKKKIKNDLMHYGFLVLVLFAGHYTSISLGLMELEPELLQAITLFFYYLVILFVGDKIAHCIFFGEKLKW